VAERGPLASFQVEARTSCGLRLFCRVAGQYRLASLVKPHRTLAETTTPDGQRLTLHERDHVYTIRLNGRGLMDSSAAASELLLGQLAIASAAMPANPRVLIGGLGLGFTLQRVLEKTGPTADIHVAELIPAVVDWNRERLLGLNGESLHDPRVQVIVDDVWHVIEYAPAATYDAILLDIDNGPIALVQRQNSRLYNRTGIAQLVSALKPGGRLAIWSAGRDKAFAERLAGAGLRVTIVPAKHHANARQHSYIIYVADKAR